jgi:hypothetical protein
MTADLPSAMRFEDLVGEFSDTDGVTPPRGGSGFGRSALRYHGKTALATEALSFARASV